MNVKKEEITGVFQTVIFAKNGFFIGLIFTENKTLTVKGNADPEHFKRGMEYRFTGTYIQDKKYGKQFNFNAFAIPEPVTAEAIQRYLRQFKGIGESRARAIVETFGDGAINIIRKDPQEVARQSGINVDILQEAAKQLDTMKEDEQVKLELISLLDGKGFPKNIYQKLIKDLGIAAPGKIKENPFILTKYRGVGFEICDLLWKSLHLPLNDQKRKQAYILYLIESDTTGSTWFEKNKLLSLYTVKFNESSFDNADVICQDFNANIKEMQKRQELAPSGGQYIATLSDYTIEQSIKDNVYRLINNNDDVKIDLSDSTLSESQYEQAVKAVQSGGIGILTGCPGTGKTYTAAQIIKAIKCSVEVCAPTGKAALRIQQAMRDNGLDITAKTIHSLLEAYSEGSGFIFKKNKEKQLKIKLIVVDESSMIDNYLICKLLEACETGTRLLFVGDTNQLPPVGRGAPLRDFISMGLPQGHLTEIRRNAGAIVEACTDIQAGMEFRFNPFPPDDLKNLVYTYSVPNTVNIVNLLNKIEEQEKTLENMQIICALNDKGACNRNNLNEVLKQYYNRDAEQSDRSWNVGDKVICLKNGIADCKTIEPTEEVQVLQDVYGYDKKCRVSNGDIGYIVQINSNETIVRIRETLVKVPRFNETWEESDWDLGYAITCHKSQGSEWKNVIVVLDPSSVYSIGDRNWIYTAISRAKKHCYLMGSKETAARMIQNVKNNERITGFSIECTEADDE